MEIINKNSILWHYLEEDLQGLILDGERLLEDALGDSNSKKVNVSDFSYLVFPFAKAYEGFMKKLFLDTGVINEKDFYGDEIRIGRILSPRYRKAHAKDFGHMCLRETPKKDLADEMWDAWHRGRNRVFHYFPHNFRRLTYKEALDIIQELVARMNDGVEKCDLALSKNTVTKESVNSLI